MDSTLLTRPGINFQFGRGDYRSFGQWFPSYWCVLALPHGFMNHHGTSYPGIVLTLKSNMASPGHSDFSSLSNPVQPRVTSPSLSKANISFGGLSLPRSSPFAEGFAEPRLPSQRGDSTPTDMGRPESLPSHRLRPTWQGFVGTSEDALRIFEATLCDKLHIVKRRPRDGEKGDIITSGNVFVYDEDDSGIKRWTDGKDWSPSRIRGNFLLYREVSEPFRSNGRKLNTNKRSRTQSHDSAVDGLISPVPAELTQTTNQRLNNNNQDVTGTRREQETSLYGSLTDSYSFKEDGLMKKTMSIAYRKKKFHLVAYYHPDAVAADRLQTVEDDQSVRECRPRREFYENQNFRSPLESEYQLEAMASLTGDGSFVSHHAQIQHFNGDGYVPPHNWAQQYQTFPTQYTSHPTASSYQVQNMYLAPGPYQRSHPPTHQTIPASYGQPLHPIQAVNPPLTPISPLSQAFSQSTQPMPPTPQTLSPHSQAHSYGQIQQSMQRYPNLNHTTAVQRHATSLNQQSPPMQQQQTSISQSPQQQWSFQEPSVGNFGSWSFPQQP